jgi:hypothetical protein
MVEKVYTMKKNIQQKSSHANFKRDKGHDKDSGNDK